MAALDMTPDNEKIGSIRAGDVKVLVEKMWNANHQLQRIIKNYEGAISDRASPFVQVNSQWYKSEKGERGDRVWLDARQ